MIMNCLNCKIMCVCVCVCVCLHKECSFAVLLQRLYHGTNVTKGFVKNILQQQYCMKEQYFFIVNRKEKVRVTG